MSFLILGSILLIAAVIFLVHAVKDHDKEGVIGVTALLLAAILLVVLFGFLYQYLFKKM